MMIGASSRRQKVYVVWREFEQKHICLTLEFFDFFHLSFLTREKKLSCVCLFLCALLRILTLSLIRDSYYIHREKKDT